MLSLGFILDSIIYVLVLRLIIWPFLVVPLFDWFDFRRQHNIETTLLELTPPISSAKTAKSTQELFRAVHSLCATQSYEDHFLHRKQLISFEVVSSRYQGIRFLVRLPERNIASFQQTMVAYLPEVQFRQVEDYLDEPTATPSKDNHYIVLKEFKQARSFVFPLRTQKSLTSHDPIDYVTASMTKPKPGELMIMQLVLSSYRSHRAMRIRRKLAQGKDPKLLELTSQNIISLMANVFTLLSTAFVEALEFTLGRFTDNPPPLSRYKRMSTGSSLWVNQPIRDRILGKLSEPLFYADLRGYVVVNNRRRAEEQFSSLTSALASFTDHGYQQLVSTEGLFPPFLWHLLKPLDSSSVGRAYHRFCLSKFTLRLPSLFTSNSCVLSASEVAGLYHFPYGQTGKIENVVANLSRTLPASVALKRNADTAGFDIILGSNQHHGTTTPIGLTLAERERHIYIIGGTGNGKTTMLLYGVVQDMKNGKGLAVVDPHGDFAETILKHVPEDRINDVIYVNPIDLSYPIGLNLLELPVGLSEDEILIEKDLVTESVISVFRKIFSDDDTGGHRIEYILRNTIHTAFTVPNATVFTVFKLLTDPVYRRSVTYKLDEGDLKNFWKNELGKAGNFQRVKMSQGVTAKIGRFRFNESAKRMLEQPRSTIDFEDIINSGKILICNFSKGNLGEDTSSLFGVTTLAKLQLAALRRARTDQTNRRPFYVYVDEFQNFATMSFVQLLSEARKYKLFLTMAEQSTSQQEEQRMVNIILANVGTVVCFRSGSPADEQFVLPLFRPYINQGEIASLPAFNFYMRIAALQTQEPLSGETLLLDDDGNKKIMNRVMAASRKRYAIEYIAPKKEFVRQAAGSGLMEPVVQRSKSIEEVVVSI